MLNYTDETNPHSLNPKALNPAKTQQDNIPLHLAEQQKQRHCPQS